VPRRQKFEFVFASETVEHVKAIESQHHSLIRTTIEEQLRMASGTPTRNRKRLETPLQRALIKAHLKGPHKLPNDRWSDCPTFFEEQIEGTNEEQNTPERHRKRLNKDDLNH